MVVVKRRNGAPTSLSLPWARIPGMPDQRNRLFPVYVLSPVLVSAMNELNLRICLFLASLAPFSNENGTPEM